MSILVLCCFLVLPALVVVSQSLLTTDPSEISALQALKSSILPSSIPLGSCLSSWNFSSDPCHPQNPTHFICGLTCSASHILSITLDSASYSSSSSSSSLPPPSFLTFSLLSHLDLSSNSFSGPIPSLYPPSLTSLSLSSNSFTGPIPPSLSSLPNLQSLFLARNSLVGPIPSSLPASLVSLDLSYNRLSGTLPSSLPKNLLQLTARGNSLSGPLPKSTSQSSFNSLETFDLAENRFSGSVPDWLFRLPSLQQVNLSNNSLSSFGMITSHHHKSRDNNNKSQLFAVDFSYNKIEGELPADFARLPLLVSFSARYNKLRGNIPGEYGSGKLRRVFLDGNYFTGEVPEGLLKVGAGSLADNCLEKCPTFLDVCKIKQKPDWVCRRVYGRGRHH